MLVFSQKKLQEDELYFKGGMLNDFLIWFTDGEEVLPAKHPNYPGELQNAKGYRLHPNWAEEREDI